MLKFLKDKKKDNKGFTLVELVIVVAILAILVGILAPQYTKYVEKSRKAADASNLENLVTAFKTAASDGTEDIPAGTYTITIGVDKANTGVSVANADGGSDSATTVEGLLNGFAGSDWKNTTLKSKKWTTTQGSTTEKVLTTISATLVLSNDGSIAVSYNPTWIKEMH